MIRAALHVHSRYSDGEFTIAELRDVYLAAGCGVVCMADHADDFTRERVAEYVAECDSLSDERLRFVPGLEFGCEQKMHIVGYGVTSLIDSTDPEVVIQHIAQAGGVGVIAHPKDAHFEWIERFRTLPDGLEVWNSKYDGKYAPRPATFALFHRLRARRPDMRAFYGQDLHWRKQFRELFTELDVATSSPRNVIAALGRGEFVGVKAELRLPSDGRLSPALLSQFASVSRRSSALRRFLKRANEMTGRLGSRLPAPIKAQLRRFF